MEESEIIDQYLSGTLDSDASANFTKEIAANVELQKKIALRKLIVAGINESYAEELKTKLVERDRLLDRRNKFRITWRMAAVLAFGMIVCSAIYFSSSHQPTAYDFDVPDPGLPNSMGMNDAIELNNAMNHFKADDYTKAGNAFEKLLNVNPKNDTVLYYSGLCDFRNKKISNAIKNLEQVNEGSVFFTKAQYRLGIAFWANEEFDKAIPLLKKVEAEHDSDLSKQAGKVLKIID